MGIRIVLRFVVIGIVTVASGGSAAAQNLVVNGDFDHDVAGWDPTSSSSIELEWDPSDCQSKPGSGSALFRNVSPLAYAGGGRQCVTNGIVGDAAYDLRAWFRVPSGQGSTGQSYIFLVWFTLLGCSGSQISGPSTGYVLESDEWVHKRVLDIVAPSDAESVWVYVVNHKTSTGGQREAFLDSISLVPAGSLFEDGFESADTSAWSNTVP